MSNKLVLALTGHRPNRLAGYNLNDPFYVQLQEQLEDIIQSCLNDYDVIECRSGLALGADTVWSKAILAVKSKHPERVLFHADIPMMEQSSVWLNNRDDVFWRYQVAQADTKTVYGSLADYPESERKVMAMRFLDERNRGMITPADIVIAIFNGSKNGGTANAVRFAEKLGKQILILNPNDMK